jgi:hypothetical protein
MRGEDGLLMGQTKFDTGVFSMKYFLSLLMMLIATACFLRDPAAEELQGYLLKTGSPVGVTEQDLVLFYKSMAENKTALWLTLQQQKRGWMSIRQVAVEIVEEKPPNLVKITFHDTGKSAWTLREALVLKP